MQAALLLGSLVIPKRWLLTTSPGPMNRKSATSLSYDNFKLGALAPKGPNRRA